MIKSYSKTDKPEVMELMRQNTPKYFDLSEEKDFEHYLDLEVEDYFVYRQGPEIIGAGGINYFPNEKIARFSWDIIDPKWQGKGIGTLLAQFRINFLKEKQNVAFIVVRTTQYAYPFYQKMGFDIEKVESKFWSENFDLYQMKMPNKKY